MMGKIIKSEAEKVTYLGGLINLFLSVIKIISGFMFQSAGLIADGFHSLSDLISDFVVLIFLKISKQKPDKEHPYGHGRFETVGTAILGGGLIYLGGIITYQAILSLLSVETIATPSYLALIAIIFSILIKEWLYHYTIKVGKKIESDLIVANAWHHRSDSLSSIAVLIGLIGAIFGHPWLDSLAAIVVAIFIFKIGISFAYQSFKELVDTSLPLDEVENLTKIAKSVDGVISVHDFKTRGSGSQTILEMHIQVHPFLSASEGHQIGENVVLKLEKRAKEIDIAHVIYHIDTYDDMLEKHEDYHNLPLRKQIDPIIYNFFANLKITPLKTNLYYHKKKVGVEVILEEKDYQNLSHQIKENQKISIQLEDDLRKKITQSDWLYKAQVGFILD